MNREFEQNILKARLEMQEQTFQNISREIHDDIGQKLTLAKLNLNVLEKRIPEINETIIIIGETIRNLRAMSRSLSSEIILQNGLLNAMNCELDHIRNLNKYEVDLEVEGESFFLESEEELILFRIFQEAINNVLKHSAASKIMIQFIFKENNVELVVEDNGKGLNFDHDQNISIGLINMKKRAELLKGKCTIISSNGKGTRVIINIPTKSKKYQNEDILN